MVGLLDLGEARVGGLEPVGRRADRGAVFDRSSRSWSSAWRSALRSVFRSAAVPLRRCCGDVAQVVEQQAVVLARGLAVAEQVLADDVHLHGHARADLAGDRAGVAGVGVGAAERVGAPCRGGAGEDVAAAVGGVRLALERLDELVDLRGDRVARGLAGRVARRPGA